MGLNFNPVKNRSDYLNLCNSYIKRAGIERIQALLERTDFFIAPASKLHHCNIYGGLCFHSLMVFYSLLDLLAMEAKKKGYDIDAEVSLVKTCNTDPTVLSRLEEPIEKVFGKKVTLESLAIAGLFHDFHKINYYEKYDKPIMKGFDEKGKKS